MGNREKYVYRDKKLVKIDNDSVILDLTPACKDTIIPDEYKVLAYGKNGDSTVLYENDDFICFECKEVLNEKRRLVKFKNTFYVSYITTLKLKVNYETLRLLYDTGISSKGPAGFGMIELME